MLAISVDRISKEYRLGQVSHGMLYRDLQSWWARQRGRDDPNLAIDAPRTPPGDASRRSFKALDGISFDLPAGEVLGVVGRNGAGKSTLLKILSRVTAPTTGRARIRGRLSSLLEVGTGFHPELTGRENVFMNGAILGMKSAEIRRKLDEIIAFAEVEEFADTPVKRYSSGMYARLAFAVAAHLDADILLIDEVLAVGDAQFLKKSADKVKQMMGTGRTIVLINHNLALLGQLCSKALYLERGRMVEFGDARLVLASYIDSMRAGAALPEVAWNLDDAPGDDMVRLTRLYLCGEDGIRRERFSVREGFKIVIEIDVLKGGHPIDTNVFITNEQGLDLFMSGDTVLVDAPPVPAGRHRRTATIPADLMTSGSFFITVALTSRYAVVHCLQKDAIRFAVEDDFSGSGARGRYPREWPQVAVRPLLEWQLEEIR